MTGLLGGEILRCLDCGKCTSLCPVARNNKTYSPRRMIRRLVEGRANHAGDALWSCLTCMYCDARCPQEVTISGAMPILRHRARQVGEKPPFTRCGAMDSIMVLQSQAEIPQNRLDWIPKDVHVDPESKTQLWVGCLPYFDTFFTEIEAKTIESAIAAIRILNALGIEPAVLREERCCGHDALWSGDEETFTRLAEMNVKTFNKRKPELIVTVCPECAMTLSRSYKERFGAPACEVKHITEMIAEHARELELSAKPIRVTFQDPCRLGRHMQQYEAPRQALGVVPELTLTEMAHSRASATCCAGSWMLCNQSTKQIQLNRLREAAATKSELLVTACPKCWIHLRCAQSGEDDPGIEIRDLASLVASALAVPIERG